MNSQWIVCINQVVNMSSLGPALKNSNNNQWLHAFVVLIPVSICLLILTIERLV